MRFAPQTTPAPGADGSCTAGSRASSGLEPCDVLNKYASGPSPAVPRDGYPVARPSPHSRYGVSCIMRAGPRPTVSGVTVLAAAAMRAMAWALSSGVWMLPEIGT